MKAKLKQMLLENFKGVINKTYIFDGDNITIAGQNGAGKSTIASAYYWIFADRDVELNTNPPIMPLGADDVISKAEIVLDIDGTAVTVAKIQKQSRKGDKVSVTNTYEVNSVEYGKRDFEKKMAEYGFDLSLFLSLAHTDVFTAQKDAEMRKVLFGMVSELNDKDVANSVPEASDVAKMLADYSLDEIKAMQNATIRKIKELYGKSGEIIDAQISGMEQSKTDFDVAELELQRSDIKQKLADVQVKLDNEEKVSEEYQNISTDILQLKFDLSGVEQKANAELVKQRRELDDKIADLMSEKTKLEREIVTANSNIEAIKNDVNRNITLRNDLAKQWKEVKEETLDESTTICPTCKRALPADEIDKIRADYEKNKQDRLKDIENRGFKASETVKNCEKQKAEMDLLVSETAEKIDGVEEKVRVLKENLSEMPSSVDMTGDAEWNEIQSKIAEREAELKRIESTDADERKRGLKLEADTLNSELTDVIEKIALANRNNEIDDRIENLRNKKLDCEQNMANAEKILYQVEQINMAKNKMLTDAVNSHFKMVKFRLFRYQKNGDVVDDCTPTLDGKPITTHANGALQVLAKLDIIRGLQQFYGQNYPVFVDDYALVTDNTGDRIDVDCQLIKLVADKSYKDIEII